jgi:hypothetical protein
MSTDDSRTSDHEPPDEHPRPGHSIHRQAVFGTEGLEVETSATETTLTHHGIEIGLQRSTRLDASTSHTFVDDRPQTNPGQRTLDGRDASMVPLFGDQADCRPVDTAEE